MKNFDEWNETKKTLSAENTVPQFREREIWWCSIGYNVGHEQDGKGEAVSRPVLVVRKFNKRLFWGIPLSTKIKDGQHFYIYDFKGEKRSALLTQLRLWDANRFTRWMGRLPQKQFGEIRERLRAYLK